MSDKIKTEPIDVEHEVEGFKKILDMDIHKKVIGIVTPNKSVGRRMDEILYNKDYNPETKVYNIAKILKNEYHIAFNLWYAILELKDKHIRDIIILEDDNEDNNEDDHIMITEAKESYNKDKLKELYSLFSEYKKFSDHELVKRTKEILGVD